MSKAEPSHPEGVRQNSTDKILRFTVKPVIFFLMVLVLLTAGCSEAGSASSLDREHMIDVDPLFREFYAHLGGMDTLGPAISPLFNFGARKYQYTQSALMVHDPEAPASQRFGLAPLGHDMGIQEPVVAPPSQTGGRFVDGHVVYEEFVSFYDQLGGVRFVGRPLTEMHINSEKRRYEQYFENLGFYRLESDPQGMVRLLAYGVWKCDTSCRRPALNNNEVVLPANVGPSFVDAVNRLSASFTGFAISDPYVAADGTQEQIFENIVLYVDNNQSGRVLARPITNRLGYLPEPMVPASAEPGYYFYPVEADRGYNIPQAFLDYISQHGGIEITGAPIGEAQVIRGGVLRQCYTNLCLEQHTSASGNVTIRPTTLGYSYRAIAGQSAPSQLPQVDQQVNSLPTPLPTDPPTPEPTLPPEFIPTAAPDYQPIVTDVLPAVITQDAPPEAPPQAPALMQWTLQVWETFPNVSPTQRQEIGVNVMVNNSPRANVEPDLFLFLPNGETRTYYMYPTGQDGSTFMTLDPIQAPSGTLIPYEVCIVNQNSETFCVRDNFLIWQGP